MNTVLVDCLGAVNVSYCHIQCIINKHVCLVNRYDEVDGAYPLHPPRPGAYPDRKSDRRSSSRPAERQNSALSRQDSGVSSHSSRSIPTVECDSASRISSLTQQSSDSGSSGHQLSRQESDAASSYSSRASTVSTSTTCEYCMGLTSLRQCFKSKKF